MNLVVNGEQLNLDKDFTLLEFIESKGLKPELIVIEYNGQITTKDSWPNINLKENDHIEILRFVGGG